MPEECGLVQINLFGGPMDGDSIIMSPAGSVGPPQQLCYMGSAKDQAAWMVYESENVFKPGWPKENEHWRFNFVGWYSLGKGELLKV